MQRFNQPKLDADLFTAKRAGKLVGSESELIETPNRGRSSLSKVI
jgi:hypothetical protein